MAMPPYQNAPAPMGQKPNNHLVMAIIAIFFCWPLAIFAIVKANQVDKLWAIGDVNGATASSSTAKTSSIISYVIGGIGYALYIVVVVIMGAAAVSTGYGM